MKKYFLFSSYVVLLIVLVFGAVGAALALLYPIKHEDLILLNAEKYNLQPELVASVINVESGFNENSVSDDGAIGLMQLMPTTAVEIANLLGYNSFKVNDLFKPDVNIEFGCYYLRYLTNKYNGNTNNVLAGYNAGFNNVNSWLINTEYSADGYTIDTTPYTETNNFINRVNNGLRVYKNRFN